MWTFHACHKKPGTHHTTKIGCPTLVLTTHFAAKITLIAFLNQRCERPSLGFECNLIALVAECIRWIYALSWHINGGTTLCTSEITQWGLASNWQRTVSHMCMTDNCLLVTGPDYLLQAPTDSYVGLCFHIIWCNMKGVGDSGNIFDATWKVWVILVTYLNSASKNTSETDIFPHGTKSMLTSVILPSSQDFCGSLWGKFVNCKHNKMILPSIPVNSMISVQCSHRLSRQYVTTAHVHKLLNI
jgi:hypothetical protein